MIRGELWWADLGIPFGSEPGYKRPVVLVQSDAFNRSTIQTAIVVSITANMHLAEAPGNVFLDRKVSGLSKDGVVDISRISTIDKRRLVERICVLPPGIMTEIDFGIRLVLDTLYHSVGESNGTAS